MVRGSLRFVGLALFLSLGFALAGSPHASAAVSGPGNPPTGVTKTTTPVEDPSTQNNGWAGKAHSLQDGYASGSTTTYSGLGDLSSYSHLYFGVCDAGTGRPLLKLSGELVAQQPGDTLSFNPAGSNLPGGVLQFTGSTTHKSFQSGSYQTVTDQTRLTMKVTRTDGTPLALASPSGLGLPSGVGGVLDVKSLNTSFKVNYLFEASPSNNVPAAGFQPALDMYNNSHTDPSLPNPRTRMSACTSFFWNRYPVAAGQSVSVDRGVPKAINLGASSPDGKPLTYSTASGPSHGSLSGTAPNLTYTPDAGYVGSDSFTFKANDGLADSNIATVSIDVITHATSLTYLGDTSVQWQDLAALKAKLVDNVTSGVLAGRTVHFTLGSYTADATTDASGIAQTTLTLTDDPGDYTAGVSFDEQEFYLASSTSAPFTILKRATTLSYAGDLSGTWLESANVSATFLDASTGDPLAGRLVHFTLGSEQADATTDATGLAQAALALSDVPGTYTIGASVEADGYFLGATASETFSILKRATALANTGPSSGTWLDDATVSATLTDVGTGNPLGGMPVHFTLGSGTADATTDLLGSSQSQITLNDAPGAYSVGASFVEDAYYLGASDLDAFDILKRATALAYTGATSGVYLGEPAALSATLTDVATGAGIADKTVNFALATQTADAVTGLDGAAAATVPMTDDKGIYTLTSSYAEDGYYLASSVDVQFEIVRRPTITTYTGDTSGIWQNVANVSATITDEDGNPPDIQETLHFTLGTQSVDAVTDSGGVAVTTIPLSDAPGTYTLRVAFDGNNYSASSTEVGFAINKRASALDYTGATVQDWGVAAAASATLTDAVTGAGVEGKTITFTLGQASAVATTGADGVASTTITPIDIPSRYVPNPYTITAAFAEDGFYLGSSDGATFEITRGAFNRAPVAVNDEVSTPQYQVITIETLANDSDPDEDPISAVSVTQPAHGVTELNNDGTVTYRPNANFKDDDTFTYTITDDRGAQTTATVHVIAIRCGNDGIDHLDGTPAEGVASDVIDRQVEPLVGQLDPYLPATIHDINCNIVVPTENQVDELLP